MDSEIIKGITLWLKTRQIAAVHLDNKDMYECISVLIADVESSSAGNEYPWELIMRRYNDRARGLV